MAIRTDKLRTRSRNRALLSASLFVLGGALATRALGQQLVSNGESVFNTSETDSIGNFSTYDLTFNTTSANTPLTLNLTPLNASTPSLNVLFGGLTQTGNYNATINGGVLNSQYAEIDAYATGTITVNSAFGDSYSTPLLLTMSGPGTMVLNNTSSLNTMDGGIYINGGTIQISSDLNLGANAGNANGIYFNGGTLQATAGINFSSTRVLTVNTGNGTFYANAGTVSTLPAANQLISGDTSATFTKDGPGALILGSSNAYSGPVTINNGTLQLNNLNALGAVGSKSAITLNNNGQLKLRYDGPFTLDGNGNYSASFGNNITINGANTNIDVGYLTSNSSSGNVQLGSLNFPVNSTLNVTDITGASRSLEFTGTTTIGVGNSSSAVTINNSINVRLGGQLTGNGSLTKTGPGTLYLSGTAPNTYASYTNVSGGTLVLDKSIGTNAVPGDLQIFGGTVILQTSGQIASTSNVTLSNGTLNVDGQTNTVNALNNSGGTVMTGKGTLSVTSPDTTALNSGTTIINNGGTLNSLHLAITGGTNNVQAGGSISVGSVGLTFTSVAPAFGPQMNPTITLSADPANPGELYLQGPLTYNCSGGSGVGTIANTGTAGLAGTLDLGGATRTFTIAPFNSGQTSTSVNMLVSTAITDGGIDKEGTGTLQLSGSNSYQGGTTIGGGIFQATSLASLGTGPVTFTGGTLNLTTDSSLVAIPNALAAGSSSTISLNVNRVTTGLPGAFTIQVPSLTLGSTLNLGGSSNGTLAVTGPVTLQNNVAINATSNLALNGAISGAYGISISGTGTVIFGGSSNNTYTGNTTVSSGTLLLQDSSAVAVPGPLMIGSSGTVTLGASEQISSTAQLTLQNSSSLFNLNNFTETIGSLVGSAGTIQLGTTGTGTLNFGSAGDTQSISTIVTGNGLLVKNGSGNYTFNGANTYNGGATVNAGTLSFTQTPAQLSGTTLTGGTWTVYGGATLSLPGSITTNAATIVLNGPSATFNAINNLATNTGTFSLTNGAQFSQSTFSNTGTLNVGGGSGSSNLTITTNLNQYSAGTLNGGTYNLFSFGTITLPSGEPITTIGPTATINLSGGTIATGSGSATNGLATNKGTFSIVGQNFTTAGNFNNSGTINVGGSSANSVFTITGNLAQITGTTLTGGTFNILANGSLVLNGQSITTIGPAATVTLSGANASFPGLTTADNLGTLTIASSAFAPSTGFANDGMLNFSSGSNLTLSIGLANAIGSQGSAGTCMVPAGTSLVTNYIRQQNLTVAGTVQIQPRTTTDPVSIAQNLNLTGSMDITNNSLVTNTSIGSVTAMVASAYSGGLWTGPGLTSSTAASDTTHLTAVGAILNNNGLNQPLYTTFEGAPATLNEVLVKYTYYGDTNLDGKVDGSDYSRIDSAYHADLSNPAAMTGWFNADFNYDNLINGSDYTLMDNTFNSQGATITASIATPTAQIAAGATGTAAVPEPASISLLTIGAIGLLRRRRHPCQAKGPKCGSN